MSTINAKVRFMATTSARVLTLLSLLGARREWTAQQLSERLAVSTRTVRRDLDSLRELGYPVDSTPGPTGGYRLGAGGTLPPLMFDDDQAIAVALALQSAPITTFGLDDAVARALATLTQVMPTALRAQVEALTLTSVRNYWELASPPIAREVLTSVGNAIRNQHVLRFDYLRPDGSRPAPSDPDFSLPQRIEPHHLVLWAGRWYLVGRDPASGEWPIRRVDRIHPRDPTGQRFTRSTLPAESVGAYVITSYDRGDTPAHWQCQGSAVMHLPAEVVAQWAPGGSAIEYVDAARTRITVGAWSWAGVAGLMLTFDTELTDIQPEELRDAYRTICRRVAGQLADETERGERSPAGINALP